MKNENIVLVLYASIFLVLSYYHFFVFLGRRKDKSNLSYALLNLSVFFMLLFNRILPRIYGYNSYTYLLSMIFVSFAVFAFTYFPHTVFNLKKLSLFSKSGTISVILLNALSILFYYILKNNILKLLHFFFSGLYAFIFLIIFCIYIIKSRQYNNIKERIIILGYSAILLSMFFLGILRLFEYKVPVYIYYSLFVFMIIAFSYALISSFNKEHKDLIELKNTLEERVKLRTNELAMTNKKLEIANKEIEKKSQEKIDFFINLAHETKTPLTLISSYIEKDIIERGKTKSIEIVKSNIDKLCRDMVNFLDSEKLERGQVFYNHNQIVCISKILEEKILLFKEIANRKNIEIKSEIEKEILIKIDPYALDRVINNILDNAVKYNNEYGRINVILKSEKKFVQLFIIDNGIGMTDNQIKHVFEPYYQISHKKRNVQGIGMGLNIVKKIVDELNGEIEIKSKAGERTEFKISFIKEKNIKNTEVKNINISRVKSIDNTIIKIKQYDPLIDGTILIVEDNVDLINLLISNFDNQFNIFYALNGKEGLKKLSTMPVDPDVIISDIMMDVMNGYEFAKEVRKIKKYQYTPFIFLTAKATKQDEVKGYNYMGAFGDYITKPFNMHTLYNKISNAYRTKRFIDYVQSNIYEVNRNIILLVDDDLASIEITKKRLPKDIDIEVYSAVNGIDALKKIERIPMPTLIIADCKMPKMDGYELLEKIRNSEKYSHIPYVFLTGYPVTDAEKVKGRNLGAEFIEKTQRKQYFQDRIKNILENENKNTEIYFKIFIDDYIKRQKSEFELTPKEIEVISLIKKNKMNKEIATELGISLTTVKKHVQNIFHKTGCSTRLEVSKIKL